MPENSRINPRPSTHGIAWMSHGSAGIARMSHGSARKTPGTPQLSQDGKIPGIYRQSTRMFQTVSNIRGRTRIEPELPGTPRIYYGFATEFHGLPTDYPRSNRSTPDRRSVAFRRPTRESVTGALHSRQMRVSDTDAEFFYSFTL